MKYELTIADRIVLVQLFDEFPRIGGYLYYTEFGKVAAVVSIGEPEQKAIDWKADDEKGVVTWNGEKAKVKTVEIPACILKPIKAGLIKKEKDEQLKPEHIPVYEKFVPEDERPKPEEPKAEEAPKEEPKADAE